MLIREYIADAPPAARKAMRVLRSTIRQAAPDAEEGFGYGIPGVRLAGRALVYYAAWSTFCSMYPITGAIRKAFAAELKGCATSKGTVRFSLAKAIPVTLVRKLVKARIVEVRAATRRRTSRE